VNARRLTAWPPPVPLLPALASTSFLPFPLDQPGCRLYARARHGLWNGIRALGVEAGDEALVPAYHHGSEVEVLRRAGVVCRFYEGNSHLEPDEAELESLLTPRTRLLHLIHYLGLPADAGRWRRWCDTRGLFLVEDAAQSWLATRGGRPVGAVGDLAVFSVYKTFGLPDGGATVSSRSLPPPGRGNVATSAKRQAAWLSRRVPLLRRSRRPGAYDPVEDFALGDPSAPASGATRFLLRRLASGGAAARRRANYERLRQTLGDLVPSAFPVLAEGASPFVFPIAVHAKDRALEGLAGAGIEAMNLWSVPHPALPEGRFPRAAMLRQQVVGLPVHQRLREEDLERIVLSVRTAPGIEG
jgi:dTDP-4-amino-4,6-dideoxygalactose transaminase